MKAPSSGCSSCSLATTFKTHQTDMSGLCSMMLLPTSVVRTACSNASPLCMFPVHLVSPSVAFAGPLGINSASCFSLYHYTPNLSRTSFRHSFLASQPLFSKSLSHANFILSLGNLSLIQVRIAVARACLTLIGIISYPWVLQ